MLGRRGKLSVLAEIAGPASREGRAWSLRRADLEALSELKETLGEHRVVLVAGDENLAAATALAGALTAAGRRAALLECDLALPRLAASLGLSPAPGLHEYLRWEATAAEIVQPLALAGPAARGASGPLVCVVAGRRAADPATLIGLESFRHAIAKLRRAYELVVLVGPSFDSSYGSLTAVAAQADALVAAVSAGEISGRAGRGLRAALRKLPVETAGAIVVGAQRS